MPATAAIVSPAQAQRELAEEVAKCYADPLRFVLMCYQWGHGTLAGHTGPDVWQHEFLTTLGHEVRSRGFDGHTPVQPIRMAVSKGHGVGGSVMCAWLVDWIMSTREHAQGTVTANTFTQLETKTWATIQHWTKMCLTASWFEIGGARMYHKAHPNSWFCSPQSCREENSEAFAGQHAANSTSFYINDEDSAVPDVIHQVEEGGMTDGEPMQFLFGNATRNHGSFHAACFGARRDRYRVVIVDSRTSRFTNKQQIAEWAQDYGEDSDFFRVRVRGLPPSASDLQFIDSTRVYEAQKRKVLPLADEPLIAGVDVSDGGSAWTVCRFRRGADATSMPPIRLPGDPSPDYRQRIISVLAERLRDQTRERKISAMFIDSAFGSPIVERLKVLGFKNVHEIRFGSTHVPDIHYANQRAYQWGRMKDWLANGSIPREDTRLEADLTAPGFHLNRKDQIVLESKEDMIKRNVASPDDGDALSLTFAQPVSLLKPNDNPIPKMYRNSGGTAFGAGWMRLAWLVLSAGLGWVA